MKCKACIILISVLDKISYFVTLVFSMGRLKIDTDYKQGCHLSIDKNQSSC